MLYRLNYNNNNIQFIIIVIVDHCNSKGMAELADVSLCTSAARNFYLRHK